MWFENMGMVVDPNLAFNCERSILPRCPFRTVFTNKNKRFIKKKAFNKT